MKIERSVQQSREYYLQSCLPNLTFLFEKRYGWMEDYLQSGEKILEVGCGMGITKIFLDRDIILSDVENHPWIDRQEDAMKLSYDCESIDTIICSNMIHHLPQPLLFFQEANRVLKVGGKLLIQEVNCGLMLKLIMRLVDIEYFDFDVDVFDRHQICKRDVDNHWQGNNAIPNLLFDDIDKFERNLPFFKIVQNKYSEFFIYIASGGITVRLFTIPLPYFLLKILDVIDDVIITFLPKIFALQRSIVLVKIR